MSHALSNDFKELVRARTDLVALIGESVTLHSKGREFVGLCPFHDDHNPSMRVNPERQSFRCWVCDAGGDCFSFVMLRERVEFREALEMLAARARLEMPKSQGKSAPADPLGKQRMFELLAWAEQQFHQCLLEMPVAAEARDYLAERRLTRETIVRCRLGYHPDDWNWLQNRARGKWSSEQLLAVRLIGQRSQGNGYYDNFVDRVLFPIGDGQGHVVAFGGRVLPGHANADQGKYWNSPESPVFAKSRLLYGLEMAREAIRESGVVVVVEGYTDCIVAHQCGVLNVVGTLGTALTEMHVTTLKRFARKVVLVYDGDSAGQKASERALPRFLAQEIDLRLLTLPGGLDPADALLEHGKEWFEDQVARAVEVWEYKFRCVLDRHGLDSVDASYRVLEEMLESLCDLPVFGGATVVGPWQVREDILLGKLSQRLGLPEKGVRERLAELRRERARRVVRASEAAYRPAEGDASAGPPPSASEMEDALSRPRNSQPQNQNRRAPTAAYKMQQGGLPSDEGGPQGHIPSVQFQRLTRRPTKDEQIECELLQILFANPETVDSIQREIHPEDFQQPHLRALLELCFHLAKDEQPLSFERILSNVAPSLQQLVAFLDEQGRQKVTPELLDHLLFCVRQRREFGATATSGTAIAAGQLLQPRLDGKASLRRAAELASAREEMKASRKRVTKQ